MIATLTGFSLDNVLSGLDLPTGPGLSNQLGITGVPSINAKQIYNDKWDEDEEVVGPGEGEDFEDEVDRELAEEDEQAGPVKMEVESPRVGPKQKRKRVIRRLVERPKTVYERFPTFEKDKVLDFTELFKGVTIHKSRISKRPFTSTWRRHSRRCGRPTQAAAGRRRGSCLRWRRSCSGRSTRRSGASSTAAR